ncbi:hypothetical protein LshimejAT787_1501490 [Lyophyllum shimeji]|uniref:Uncharacterized protein n=1 Tax=Lyophyllum shimeji TaxID=47721 RepID=A0A9P3PVY8_LYOSH|nr:hypothetical protein LshimejAT787_1501490 [Lyophyllum shimeji]
MYSTRAASGSRPLIPPASAGLRTSPPASVLIPPDSSFLHRRIPDSQLIVAPRPPDRRTYRARTRQGLLRLVLFGSPLASFV